MIEIKRTISNRLFKIGFLLLISLAIVFSITSSLSSDVSEYAGEFNDYLINQDLELLTNIYLIEQIEYKEEFKDFVSFEIENNINKLKSELFSSEKNQAIISKQNKLLTSIENQNQELSKNFLTYKLLSSSFFNMLVLVFSVLLVYIIFSQDIEVGLLRLYASTSNSMSKIFYRKILSLASLLLIFIALMGLIIFGSILFSDGNILAPIHSFKEYLAYPYSLTVAGFIMIRLFSMFLLAMISSLFILIILNLTKNTILSVSCFLLLLLVEYLLYSLIPISSAFVVIKYINLYAFILNVMQSAILFIAGVAIYASSFNYLILLVFITIFIILNYLLYCKIYRRSKTKSLISINFKSKSLFLQQAYQINLVFKGFIIVLLILAYGAYKYYDYNVLNPDWKIEFKSVQESYLGAVNEDTILELEIIIAEAKDARSKAIACQELECSEEEMMDYQIKSNGLWIYEQLNSEISEVLMNGNNYYINDDGFDLLYGSKYIFSMRLNFLLVAVGSLLVIYIHNFGLKSKKISRLLTSTKAGNSKMHKTNLIHYNLIGLSIFSIVYLLYVLKLSRFYDLFAITFDMKLLSLLPFSISNINFLVITLFFNLLLLSLIINSAYYLLWKYGLTQSIVYSFVFIGIILISSFIAYNISPLMLLTVSVLENYKVSIIYFIGLIVLNGVILNRNSKIRGGNL